MSTDLEQYFPALFAPGICRWHRGVHGKTEKHKSGIQPPLPPYMPILPSRTRVVNTECARTSEQSRPNAVFLSP